MGPMGRRVGRRVHRHLQHVHPPCREGSVQGGSEAWSVAGDAVAMAAPGELVYVVASREAALAMPEPFVPVDHAVSGIVGAVEPVTGGVP